MERYFDCSCDCTDCAVADCDFVKNAVAKQIPKKPSEVDEKQDGLFYLLSFMCPACNEPVIGQPYRPKHCKHCGQKLDWGDK